jgi:transposase
MARIEARRGIDLGAFLQQRYELEGRTQAEIADELGVDISTITRWMARLGIEARLFASDRKPEAVA